MKLKNKLGSLFLISLFIFLSGLMSACALSGQPTSQNTKSQADIDREIMAKDPANMTKEELKRLNELVSPLILQHQSLNHIFATHAEEIGVSRATLYKYIAEGILDAKTMDLPRKIRYKKRKKAKNAVPQRDYSSVNDDMMSSLAAEIEQARKDGII